MHGMNDEVNMRRYGALRRFLPATFGCFLVGYLAIIGIPPFSGFFTKDGIIEAAWDKGGTSGRHPGHGRADRRRAHRVLHDADGADDVLRQGPLGGRGAGRTRETPETGTAGHGQHPHESPWVMIWPMIVLSIGSIVTGGFLIINGRFDHFLEPVVGPAPDKNGIFTVPGDIALALVVVGVGLAWLMYGRAEVPAVAPAGSPLTKAARQDLYGDAFNESVLMRPGQWLTRLSVYFDNRGVDGVVNTAAAVVGGSSGRLRRIQTGFVRSYALSMFFGAALLVAALLAVRL